MVDVDVMREDATLFSGSSFYRAAAVVITADSVATTDVAVEMTAYGSSYFFSAVADVVTETASANRRQTSMGDLKFP